MRSVLPMMREVIVQATKKPVTNLFPAKYLPKSMTAFLARGELTPPVAAPAAMRGKLCYDRSVCNGCGLCMKVCPAHAIEHVVYPMPAPESVPAGEKPRAEKRIRIYVGNCIFCGQCIDICPKGAIQQSGEFLLAAEDRFAESQIVE